VHFAASTVDSAYGTKATLHAWTSHLSVFHNLCNEKAQEKEPDLLVKDKPDSLKCAGIWD
jgi:hypothetical protein